MSWEGHHLGRSFNGTAIEDDCPCPKAPCGLIIGGQESPECGQHHPGKTIRQGHAPDQCPGTPPRPEAA